MRIAVCVKEVLDARVPVQVSPGPGQITQAGGEIRLINPADRAALEVALALKASRKSERIEIEAFTVAKAGAEAALHHALARGVEGAERIEPWADPATPVHTALALAHRLAVGSFDLVFFGDETLDNSSAMVGPLVAELLGVPQVSSVSKLESLAGGACVLTRKLEKGHRERVEARLPLALTFVSEAMPPRYVSERTLDRARTAAIRVATVPLEVRTSGVPVWPENEKRLAPRARIKKRFAPDAKLSASDRVKAIMSGGAQPQTASSSTSVVDGETAYVVEQLYRFMKHHEFI
jgi:electron transfer flavoprotein beta subunit